MSVTSYGVVFYAACLACGVTRESVEGVAGGGWPVDSATRDRDLLLHAERVAC